VLLPRAFSAHAAAVPSAAPSASPARPSSLSPPPGSSDRRSIGGFSPMLHSTANGDSGPPSGAATGTHPAHESSHGNTTRPGSADDGHDAKRMSAAEPSEPRIRKQLFADSTSPHCTPSTGTPSRPLALPVEGIASVEQTPGHTPSRVEQSIQAAALHREPAPLPREHNALPTSSTKAEHELIRPCAYDIRAHIFPLPHNLHYRVTPSLLPYLHTQLSSRQLKRLIQRQVSKRS
jgi:hypothetical protein